MTNYDYVVVGAGLYGATFARLKYLQGYKVLVVDNRDLFGGNCATEKIEGITVHKHGAHIFHTNDEKVWTFVNQFCAMKPYVNNVKAYNQGKMYSLPFNMNTFYELWGVTTIEAAKLKIKQQQGHYENPKNLYEQAINLVGDDIFEILIKDYTEKQWGKKCSELPPDIIKRLPLRFEWNNNYFNDKYQAIPEEGYSVMVERMLRPIDNITSEWKDVKDSISYKKLVYTGAIDEYFDYILGHLQYRTLKFNTVVKDAESFQGTAVINYTGKTPYTRSIEHKYFLHEKSDKTVVTIEYPKDYQDGDERYYPMTDEINQSLYRKYAELAKSDPNLHFGGRLGSYKYMNMDQVIAQAMKDAEVF